MSRTFRRRVVPAVFAVLTVFISFGQALAQEAPAKKPAVKAPPTDAAAAGADTPLREQTIYIPYEKLRKVFEKEGRGVFLPYEKFRELWDAARDKTARPEPDKPPVGALITEIDNEATVSGDVVRVEARLKIEVLAEGWSEVPLRLADAAITSSTLDGQPARIVSDGQGYKLLVENKTKKPRQLDLELEYAKAITRAPGQNSVSFASPQAPVSRWKVTIPEAGVKVNLEPLIAATEVQVDEKGEEEAAADSTTILAFVGAAPTVRIDWTPKAEGAAGLAALASVRAEQQVIVGEGVTRTRVQLAYTISRAEMSELSVEVPADHKVVNVVDANVRQWSVETSDDRQTIAVQLFEPAKGTQNVTVELEKFTGEEESRTSLSVPVVRAVDVGRQQGVLVLQLAESLRAEPTRSTGLLQIDAADLPGALARGKWAFAYRYAAVPFDLVLSVEKVQPRIVVDSLVEARLTPESLSLDVLAVYTIQRAGVFRLEMGIPAGYEVRQVAGREAAGASPVVVDTHHVEGDEDRRLVVNLARKALGRVALLVRMERSASEYSLDKPSESEAQIPLPVPQVPADSEAIQQASGRLIVSAPESLRVNPQGPEGLRSVSFQEALEGMQQSPPSGGVRLVLAYTFSREPATLTLAAQRRRPQVTVRQLLLATVENGVVKYDDTLFYEVLYSGIPALVVDVPEDVADRLRIETPGFSEKAVDVPAEERTEGCIRWSLAGEAELLGSGQIKLVWEDKDKIAGLDVDRTAELTVPRLFPIGADRAWGQIVLAKTETIDVQAAGDLEGLRPIDPQYDLMAGAKVAGAAQAFEFHDDWTEPALNVTATRYELKEVKLTSIERAVLRAVVTRADAITVQALYRMRSARQRLALQMPAGVTFDAEPRLDGRPVTLEVGQNDQYFVPLVDSTPDKSFLLEFRYTVPNDGNTRIDCPSFPDEPAVQKVYLAVYLPEEQNLVGTDGPWTEEFSWRLDDWLNWMPRASQSEAELLGWVSQPIALDQSFPTDGQLYLFSALGPADPPAGSLRLSAVHEDVLSLAVVLLVLVGGVALLPAGAGLRAFMVGLLVIALVACGVFYPILAHQLLDGVLAAAVLIVLVVWTVWYFVWTRPRRRPPRGEVAPPPPVAAPPRPEPEKSEEAIIAERVSEQGEEQPPGTDESAERSEDDPKDRGEKGGQTDA